MRTRNKTHSKSLICLVLALALITGALGYLSKGFTDWNYNDWLKKPTTQTATANNSLDNLQSMNSPVLRAVGNSGITYENGKFYYTYIFPNDFMDSPYTITAYIRNGYHATEYAVMQDATTANGRVSEFYHDEQLTNQSKTFEFSFPNYALGTDYSVVLHFNGYYSDDTYSNVFYSNTASLPLPPSPTKEGYTFKGWYMDKACTTPYDGSPIYSSTTLYAGWTINTFTVTFNSDGGSSVSAKTVDWNTTITPLEPTREGYLFLGWFINSTTQYTGQAIKSNTTLIAHWQAAVYTVTFIVDDETYVTMEIPYGTRLVEAVEKANLRANNILAVSVPGGKKQDVNATDFQIVANSTVELTSMNTVQQVTNDWQKYLAYALLGVLLVSILACIPLMARRKRKYNK